MLEENPGTWYAIFTRTSVVMWNKIDACFVFGCRVCDGPRPCGSLKYKGCRHGKGFTFTWRHYRSLSEMRHLRHSTYRLPTRSFPIQWSAGDVGPPFTDEYSTFSLVPSGGPRKEHLTWLILSLIKIKKYSMLIAVIGQASIQILVQKMRLLPLTIFFFGVGVFCH